MKSSLLLTDRRFLDHQTGTHPESPARLQAIWERLGLSETLSSQEQFEQPFSPVSRDLLQRVHNAEYLRDLERFCEQGGGMWDADTVLTEESFEIARLASGAAVAAVDAVMTGEKRNALCLVRPPGHHATSHNAMGFCLFCHVAVAAQRAIEQYGIKRVLIVDWDVHHGNGTQEIFYAREDVHFFSMHRYPLYPFSGKKTEIGFNHGQGATRNVPVPFHASRQEVLELFSQELTDFAARAQPELILISAGFDAHFQDPIGGLHLETEDFGHMTRVVMQLADQYCDGRLVSLLEGGYHLEALADSVAVHWECLQENPN